MIPVQGIHDMVLERTHNFANLVNQNDTKIEDANILYIHITYGMQYSGSFIDSYNFRHNKPIKCALYWMVIYKTSSISYTE